MDHSQQTADCTQEMATISVNSCQLISSVMLSPSSDRSFCTTDDSSSSSPCSLQENAAILTTEQSYSAEAPPKTNKLKSSQVSHVIPKGTKLLDHQVGGHLYRNGKLGFLTDSQAGVVLKPIQSFPRGMVECAFYAQVFAEECTNPVLLSLRQFIPRYHGVVHIPENDVNYMRLEDVTTLVSGPVAVMDVKMGRHTWDPRASTEKRKRAEGKYPYAAEIGFQVTGFRTEMSNENEESQIKHYYSDYTRSIHPDDLVAKVFRVFFGDSQLRRCCLERIINRLQHFSSWFHSQRSFRFYSSSILLVHSTKCNNNNDQCCSADIKLVDFAHVYPANGEVDDNFLHGLDTLISFLKRLYSFD